MLLAKHILATVILVAITSSVIALDHTSKGDGRSEGRQAHRQRLNRLLFSQIETDLKPWSKTGITLEQVERTYCTSFKGGYIDGGFRLQIIGGEMFVVGELIGYPEFNRHVKLFLLDVARHHKLPDVDLVLSTSDKCHQPGKFNGNPRKCDSMAPLFAYGKRKEDDHCVLYPDHTFGGWPTVNLPSWQDTWELMEATQLPAWQDRADSLYFRGATTGNRMYLDMDKSFMQHPNVDAEFSRWTGDPNGTFASLPEHCHSKYLLHLPGQAYSSRLKNLLLCKAPVIFPKDPQQEFWYHLLEDGDNIISVQELTYATNGTEILRALDMLRLDESKAQKIALNGHDIVKRSLHPGNVRRYFAQLITAYSALQRFAPQKHPDAVPMAISALSPDRNTTMAGRTCHVCQQS